MRREREIISKKIKGEGKLIGGMMGRGPGTGKFRGHKTFKIEGEHKHKIYGPACLK